MQCVNFTAPNRILHCLFIFTFIPNLTTCRNGKYQSTDNTKMAINNEGLSLINNEEIPKGIIDIFKKYNTLKFWCFGHTEMTRCSDYLRLP